MKLDHYTLEAGDRLYTYEFTSIGPKGSIPKLVQFTMLDEEANLYNLSFGDLNRETGEIDDEAVTDNKDTDKVLATVVQAVYTFCEQVDKAWVYATGRTPSRTRLYQMGLNKYINVVRADFTIYSKRNDDWELFVVNQNYQAFLVQKWPKFEI